jgi:hypothetical protein
MNVDTIEIADHVIQTDDVKSDPYMEKTHEPEDCTISDRIPAAEAEEEPSDIDTEAKEVIKDPNKTSDHNEQASTEQTEVEDNCDNTSNNHFKFMDTTETDTATSPETVKPGEGRDISQEKKALPCKAGSQ